MWDNIKVYLKQKLSYGMHWMRISGATRKWQDFVKTALKLEKCRESLQWLLKGDTAPWK
jgi:hypothetical protein